MMSHNSWDDYDDSYLDDIYRDEEDFTNSSGSAVVSVEESTVMVGSQAITRNSLVNQLPVGSLIEVVSPGVIEVVDIPSDSFSKAVSSRTGTVGSYAAPAPVLPTPEDFAPGDRINTKYGPATVVGLTQNSRKAEFSYDSDVYVPFIADSDPVVRFTRASKLA